MAFFPTSLSGLAAWYDASDSATVTGADPVTQWADKSGNARQLSHATLGPQHDAVQNVMQLRGGAWSGTSADTLDMPAMTVRSVFVFLKAITPQTASSRYHAILGHAANTEIGRASCRERVCQYGWNSVGAGTLKKKNRNHNK